MKPFHRSPLHRISPALAAALLALPFSAPAQKADSAAASDNWYSWRGPDQNGTSTEKYARNAFNEKPLWIKDLGGRGAPVVAAGRVYVFGCRGTGQDVFETLTCFDAASGKQLWERTYSDFLSDNAYNRYAIGSPTVDPETGHIFLLTTPGIMVAVDQEGKTLWQRSMMEEAGRLSFPNGRTGAPVIVNDLVIVRGITANWGGDGPARDRLYAYQKTTGDLVWASTPGVQPQDSSFGTPLLNWRADGSGVLYIGTGCGNLCAVNALTGKPLWRWKVAKGGVNSSIVKYHDLLICIHDKECVDVAEFGRMAAVKIPAAPPAAPPMPTDPAHVTPGWDVPVLEPSAEVWRLPLIAESSSPVIAGDLLFQVDQSGNLHCLEPETGKRHWELKLGPGNTHASPLFVNGLLYCPLQNDVSSQDGLLYVIKPTPEKGEILHKVKLEGYALGAPSAANGRLYLTTAKKFYCFQIGEGKIESGNPAWPGRPPGKPGPAVALQVIPQEVILTSGGSREFSLRAIDAKGYPTGDKLDPVKWESFIPPTAKVKSTMDAAFDPSGRLVAKPAAHQSAGAFKATAGKLSGLIRGRVLPSLPLRQDFEQFELAADPLVNADGVKFAYPPLPWIGARMKWEVREMDGNKVLYKTMQPVFAQRGTSFFGSPEWSNYTVEADVMTDKIGRTKGEVGIINQRYVIMLNGNGGGIEVNSNHERLKVTHPFTITPRQWYRLKSRVDVAEDGSGTIRAKAWKKGEAEPEAWTLEVPHAHAHTSGAPGIFGFALQGKVPVYIDNILVSPNK
ncbi:MAG: PQQ-binding-like beta-propeller repeat protein [Verrucomicrobiales bacterium]|nr:PQQ-binding-like beta-propeller repeat protein [Verrucomicrobiales bacterium]